MPAGLQVFNDSGIIQIDGTYSNLQLVARGSATTSMQTLAYNTQPNGTFQYDTPYVQINFTGTTPVFAVSGGSTVCVISTAVSGNSWTIGIVTPNGPTSFEWFVFDKATPSGTNVGLQVFNESGQLVFDAGQKYIRVLGSVLGVVPSYTSGTVSGYTNPLTYSYSYPGKKCAVGAILTPFNYGDRIFDSGVSTIPSNPNCRAFGFGGWRGVNGAAYFDFVHTILSYRGYYNGSAGNQCFAASVSATDSSIPFGVKEYGGLILDVTNY